MNKSKPKQVYSVRFDECLNDSLNEYSANTGTSRSYVIRHAVLTYLSDKHTDTQINALDVV